MDVEVPHRFPPDIFHVELQLPFPLTCTNRPDRDGPGIHLRKHEVGGCISNLRPADQKRSTQRHHSLGTIDQPDGGERLAIAVSQWCIEQADGCARPCSFAIEFDGSTSKRPRARLPLFCMPLSKKTCEGIDVCAHSDG